MKKQGRRKLQILCALSYMLVLAVFCTGCEKNALQTYDMEDYRTQEDASLYNFAQQLSDMEHVVATAMYGDDSILFYEELHEGNLLHKKVWLFSYLTGEIKLCSDLAVTVETDYISAPDRFRVLGTSPLVLWDIYGDVVYLYTDDFSGYSMLDFGGYALPSGMFVRDRKLYYMDSNTCKVYAHGLEAYSNAGVQVDYKTLCEEAQVVFVPDYNIGSCDLETVSSDGERLRIYGECLQENEYYYYIYNIKTQALEEKYCFDDQRYIVWNAWGYEKTLEKIQPSAVDRFFISDYETGKTYETKIEPAIIYSYVEVDLNISAAQDKVMFYVVDENEEEITEIFLWDYTKAESEAAARRVEKVHSKIVGETRYAELTERAEALEERYGVNIIMGENVTCDFDAYDYEQMADKERMAFALDELKKAMSAFPDGMCEELAEDYALGFNIYLCGPFSPKGDGNISDAGAFFVFDNGYYNLAMNINLDNLEANLIHEMTHAIDHYFLYCGALEPLEEEWQNCNPDGFAYLESYFDYEEEHEYTFYDDFDDIDEVYFVDEYAKTFQTEDRSRVFENFGSEYYEGGWILDATPLRRKARLLLDYCTEYLECFRVDEEYGLKEKAEELGW